MGPAQIIQGLWALFLGIIRLIFLILSVVPGMKGITKRFTEKAPDCPIKLEQERRSNLSEYERVIEDNELFTKKQFKQNYPYTYKVNGEVTNKAP